MLNKIIQNNFEANTINLIRCNKFVDVENEEKQTQIVLDHHNGYLNHRGIMATYNELKEKYFWPNMLKDITDIINQCRICKENKYDRHPIQLHDNTTLTPKIPFEIINIDLLTLNKEYFITIFDQFSKFGFIQPTCNKTGKETMLIIDNFIKIYKKPNIIIADHGLEFNNALVKNYCNNHDIKLHLISIANPKSNAVERFHSAIIEHLRILHSINKNKDLHSNINKAIIAYNNTKHSITKLTPCEILFGQNEQNKYFQKQKPENEVINDYFINKSETNQIINKLIDKDKIRRTQENELPLKLPDKVYVKQNNRLMHKYKKPIFKKVTVENYNPILGTVEIKDKRHIRKFKLDKIKL